MSQQPSGSTLDPKLAELRAQLPATSTCGVYECRHQRAAFERAARRDDRQADFRLSQIGRTGPDFYSSLLGEAAEIRQILAGIMGCDTDEVALTRNAIEGMNIGVMGINWRPGDELVTTQLEHVCLYNLIGLAAHRHGITVRTVDIGRRWRGCHQHDHGGVHRTHTRSRDVACAVVDRGRHGYAWPGGGLPEARYL